MRRAVEKRVADLAVIGKQRPFTAMEAQEWEEARQWLINHDEKRHRLFDLMTAARIGGDREWFDQIKADLMRLEGVNPDGSRRRT